MFFNHYYNTIVTTKILGCWYGASSTCLLLALNRLCDLTNPKLMKILFKDERTYYWLGLPTLYFLYVQWYELPSIFSTTHYGAFSDPFVGTPAEYKEKVC